MDKTLMEKYTKKFGIRFTRRQKKSFMEELQQEFASLNYASALIEGKGLLSHSYNYLFGNLKQIKTILVIPYDTPERKFWKKVRYYPFDGTRTASKTVVATYVPIFLFFVLLFAGLYGLRPLITSAKVASLLSLGLFLLTVILMYWMLHGFHNAHNANRNSASIAAAIDIARSLSKDERKKIGFLFTDKNKMRYTGAAAAAKDLADAGKNPTLICLDCIGVGDTLQIGFNPQNRKLANEIAKYHPVKKHIETVKLSEEMRAQHAMAHFKKAVVISCGELDEDGCLCVYGTGTSKDDHVDMDVLDANVMMIKAYLHNQK